MTRRKILITGGGIAGLTAALCLARAGHKVEVFERTKAIEPLGAGIQISPNAFHIMEALGLGLELISAGVAPETMLIMDGIKGKTLASIPLGSAIQKKYDAPYLVIHRADLHDILLKHCQGNQNIKLHFASSVDNVTHHQSKVSASVHSNGDTKEYTGDIMIGADGVHSRIRSNVFGLGKAKYSGKTAWRALIDAGQIKNTETLENTTAWLGPKAHAVTYPVRSRQFLNVVVVTQDDEAPKDKGIDAHILSNRFSDWSSDFTNTFDCNTIWTGWPLYETADIKSMADGAITIIGDAAHAVLPFAAQGAAMAIEDAFVLSQCITQDDDVENALRQFEKQRLARVQRISRTARSNGNIYHMGGLIASVRNFGMRSLSGERLLQKQDWIYRWKP